MTYNEAKQKYNLVERPLTDMEVLDLASKTNDNRITVYVLMDFSDIVGLGAADDFNDPILALAFEGIGGEDISYNIMAVVESEESDTNSVVVAIDTDVTCVVEENSEEE